MCVFQIKLCFHFQFLFFDYTKFEKLPSNWTSIGNLHTLPILPHANIAFLKRCPHHSRKQFSAHRAPIAIKLKIQSRGILSSDIWIRLQKNFPDWQFEYKSGLRLAVCECTALSFEYVRAYHEIWSEKSFKIFWPQKKFHRAISKCEIAIYKGILL